MFKTITEELRKHEIGISILLIIGIVALYHEFAFNTQIGEEIYTGVMRRLPVIGDQIVITMPGIISGLISYIIFRKVVKAFILFSVTSFVWLVWIFFYSNYLASHNGI